MVKCLHIVCAKYYELTGIGPMFYKIAPRQSWRVCLVRHQNFCYWRCALWNRNSWKKQTCLQTET